MHPIVLLASDKTRATDDAGTAIVKSLVPTVSAGPYERLSYKEPRRPIPSLVYYCIRQLIESPDQLHLLGERRLGAQTPSQRKVIQHLTQGYDSLYGTLAAQTDPRVWAVLVQVYSDLPRSFQSFQIPLSDKHLPLLQEIPATANFTLTVVVELPRQSHVTDETIIQFRYLDALSYLDISGTGVTSYGLSRLSRTLQADAGVPSSKRGPWGLRAIIVKSCIGVKNDCMKPLSDFPLLCFIDLRGTSCDFRPARGSRFQPSPYKRLGNQSAAATLRDLVTLVTPACQPTSEEATTSFWSSAAAHMLVVNKLHHPLDPYARPPAAVKHDDQVVVFAPVRDSNKHGMRTKPPTHNSSMLAHRSRAGDQRAFEHRGQRRESGTAINAEANPLGTSNPLARSSESHSLEGRSNNIDVTNLHTRWSEGQTTAAALIHDLSVEDTLEPLTDTIRVERPATTSAPQFLTAKAFYAPPERQPPPAPARPPSPVLPYEPADTRLLFCNPAPWSHLDAHITQLLASQSDLPVSRSSVTSIRPSASSLHVATKDVKALESMISQRRRTIVPEKTLEITQPLARIPSRNPFAQQSSRAAMSLPTSDLHTPTAGPSKPRLVPFKPRSSLPTASSEFSRRGASGAASRAAIASLQYTSDFMDVDEIESTPPNAQATDAFAIPPPPPVQHTGAASSKSIKAVSSSSEQTKKSSAPGVLRPITTLPVPQHPAPAKVKSRKSTGSLPKSEISSKTKNMDIRKSFSTTPSAETILVATSKKRLRAESSSATPDHLNLAKKSSETSKAAAPSSVKRARSSLGESGQSASEVVQNKTSFDWSSWTGNSTK